MDRELDIHSRETFTVMQNGSAPFCFAASGVVEASCAMFHQDLSSNLTHLDARLAALASKPLGTETSDPLRPGNVLPAS